MSNKWVAHMLCYNKIHPIRNANELIGQSERSNSLKQGDPLVWGPWSPLCWATGPAFLLKSCFRTTALFKNFFHRKYWPISKKIKKKRSEFSTKKFSTIIKIIYFTKTSCHFRSKCSHFFIKAFFFSRYFVSLIETLCCTTLQVYLTKAFLTS